MANINLTPGERYTFGKLKGVSVITDSTDNAETPKYIRNKLYVTASAAELNVAGVNALVKVSTTSVNDPMLQFSIGTFSYENWTIGIDNTDSGSFKIQNAQTLGSAATLALRIDTNENISIPGDVAITGSFALGGIANTVTTNALYYNPTTKQVTYGASGSGGGGGGTPGGSDTQIQYNNAGVFGGVSALTWDGTTLRATGSFTGSLTGIATSGSSILVSNTPATSGTFYPVFVNGVSGYRSALVDNSTFTYDTTTNTLTVTASYATNALTASIATTALTASYAVNSNNTNNIDITDNPSYGGVTYYPTFVGQTTGYTNVLVDSSLFTYNPNTNVLSTTASNAILTQTASYVNPLRQTVIVTGSLIVSGSSTFTNIGPANFTGSVGILGKTNIYNSGSTVVDIQGSQGQLFSVTDALSGSLMSVNDVSGLPILEVFSDDRIVVGTYGAPALTVNGSSLIATGSLLGTASYANNVLSASYAANGGVTQLLAGPNVTLSPTNGQGQVTISATLSGSAIFNTATGSYGSFYDTTTQTNVASTARSMSFNTTDITNGVSISGSTSPFNTYIKTQNAGVYDIQFSAQVDKTDSGTDEIWIWLRKNGSNLADTATSLQLVGNGAHYVAAWNWFVNSAANDYYQIMWYSTDANVRLHAEAGFGVVPGIPSVILTVNRVDQFLSNTGSFSGSFTGAFSGSGNITSASFASTASFVNPLRQTVYITGSVIISGSATTTEGSYTTVPATLYVKDSIGVFTDANGTASINLKGSSTNQGMKGIYFYHNNRTAWIESFPFGGSDTGGLRFGSFGSTVLTFTQTGTGSFSAPITAPAYNGSDVNAGTHYYNFNSAEFAVRIASTRLGGSGRGDFKIQLATGGGNASNSDTFFYVPGTNKNISINSATTDLGAQLGVRGSGTTTATTTLRIQNANASSSLAITDDGTSTFTYPGVAGYFLKLTGAYSGNGTSAVYETLGGTGGYYGIHEFKTGISTTSSTRTLSIIYGGRVVIGNKSNSDLQNPKGNLLIDTNFVNTFSGAAPDSTAFNTGIVINPTGSIDTKTTASGIQFNFAAIGPNDNNGGAFIGTQWNPLTNGYDADLIVYATQGGPSSYNEIARFVGKRKSLSLGAGRNPSASLHISGSSNFTLLEIDSPAVNNILYVSGSGRVGIGTGTPTETLDVSGSARVQGDTTISSGTNSNIRISGGSIEFSRTIDGAYNTYIAKNGTTNNVGLTFVAANGGSYFFDSTSRILSLFGSTLNVGINTATDAGYKLDVNGTARVQGNITATGNTSTFALDGSNRRGVVIGSVSSLGSVDLRGDTIYSGVLRFSRDTTTEALLYIDYINGASTFKIQNTLSTPMYLASNFTVISGSSTTITGSLSVSGGITGSLLGTASTASFVNTLNQSVIVTGSMVIGSSSLGPFENTLTLGARDTGGEGGQLGLNASGGTYTSASMLDNYQNQLRILRGSNAGSDGLVASWNMHTKQMSLPAYNSVSAFAGTAAANLAVDSSGNVITVSTSGGTVFPYTGNAVITGSLTTTGIIYAQPNGGMYFQGGDDAALYDINISNHMGIYGVQDATVGSIKLGSGGGTISGKSGNIGIGTINPTSASLTVNGNVWATSFTGSLSGTAATASTIVSQGSLGGGNHYFLISATNPAGGNAVPVQTSNLVYNSTTNTLPTTASWASNAVTASFYGGSTISASFASTASYVNTLNQDVNINGTLTATIKSFLIEHPTQLGKQLQYGNLEGPEHAVYFRGRNTTNTIQLPEEWTGLVDESTITVQLTPIGKHQQLYVEDIANNIVTIGSGTEPTFNYFFIIHAERKDVEKLQKVI